MKFNQCLSLSVVCLQPNKEIIDVCYNYISIKLDQKVAKLFQYPSINHFSESGIRFHLLISDINSVFLYSF